MQVQILSGARYACNAIICMQTFGGMAQRRRQRSVKPRQMKGTTQVRVLLPPLEIIRLIPCERNHLLEVFAMSDWMDAYIHEALHAGSFKSAR